jgi:hypothetical protein
MASVSVPKSAKVENTFIGTLNSDTVRVTLYLGQASDGYKSNFTKRPARWIVWARYDKAGVRTRRLASRYGGNRFNKGLLDFADAIRQLRDAGVVESPAG